MDKKPVIHAWIFARGGSKGLPGKNIRPLMGKPLIAYAIETAKKSLETADNASDIPAEVMELVEQRKAARKEKNFALADELRDKIAALGYEVKETRQGTEIIKL